MPFALTPDLEHRIRELVASGRYDSPQRVIELALEALDQQDQDEQAELEELRAMIDVGWQQAERGECEPFDVEAIKAKAHAEHEQRRSQSHGAA
ncbi:MAG: type II toxin-antitoxin system ParD family antitoxin [Phycisphaeraceae bacterium]